MKLLQWIPLVLCIVSGSTQADPTSFTIPGQGWRISLDVPPLTTIKESNVPDQYMYFGNANRLRLSFYVETPTCQGGDTHEEFLRCFWPKASRNPLIQKESVKIICSDRYCKIFYEVEANIRGTAIRQLNVNLLFAYGGKWTDVHASIVNPNEEDVAALERVAASLAYGGRQ